MRTTAMAIDQPIPRNPTASPLKTLVTRKPRPWTVPTRPFALARLGPGTSRDTVVDRAMPRSCSTTAPASMTMLKIQNHGPPMSRRIAFGTAR